MEVNLEASEFAKEDNLYVTKVSEKFYNVKFRTYHDPDDVKIIKAIKQHEHVVRDEVIRHRDLERKKAESRSDRPIAGHINRQVQ